MTQLEHITDIIDLDIKSLDEVKLIHPRPSTINPYFEIEKDIMEKYHVPSLPAFLLYEHQFNGKSIRDLAEVLKLNRHSLSKLAKYLGIPLRTRSESMDTEEVSRKVRKGGKKVGYVCEEYTQRRERCEKILDAEIKSHRDGTISTLRSNREMAIQENLSLQVVQTCVTNLSDADKTYRSRQLNRQYTSQRWEDDEYRTKMKEVSGDSWKNPQRREEHRKRMSAMTTKLWQNSEYRKEGAKKMAKRARIIWADPEFAKRRAKQVGEFTKELWKDPDHKSMMSEVGKNSARNKRWNRYEFNRNHFDSQSEASAASLMEKYIPDFTIEEEKTFQVTHQISKSIDFLIRGTFVEWHPILPFKSRNGIGDIPSFKENDSYKKVRGTVMDEERKDFDKEYKQILAIAYRSSREAAIAQSPTYQGKELLLIQTPGELYDSVITRFGSNFPSRDEFVREFNQVKKQVKEANKKSTKENLKVCK